MEKSNPTVGDAPSLAHRMVNRLGLGSAVAMVGLTLLLWLVDADFHPFVSTALQSFACAVLAMLGGLQWVAAFQDHDAAHAHRPVLWGGALATLAWLGAVLPAYAGLPWLALMFAISYVVDRKLWQHTGLAPWLTLHFRVSVFAALCCALGAGAT
jgi:hypothetical protein